MRLVVIVIVSRVVATLEKAAGLLQQLVGGAVARAVAVIVARVSSVARVAAGAVAVNEAIS
jgi:hypothetical protein